jgi:hypothetical protein
MSIEHLVKSQTLPRTIREMSSQLHGLFFEKLSCIICKESIEPTTKYHECILRQKDKDIIIHNRY